MLASVLGLIGALFFGHSVATAQNTTGTSVRMHVSASSAGCRHPQTPLGSAGTPRTITVDGVSHLYYLAVPAKAARHPHPLVVEFHGYGSTAAQFAQLTRMPQAGPRHGYIVVTPQGPGSTWQLSGTGTDAHYIEVLLASVEESLCVDLHRVYAMGFSQGAAFTILYTCAHPAQIAALSTVAVEFQLGCKDRISLLAFHGTADPAVPYENGAMGVSLPGVKVRGTLLNMGDWARLDECRSKAQQQRLGPDVVRSTWPGCRRGNQVVLYTVVGGGHTWPGSARSESFMDTTETVRATNLALAFFDRHRR